MFNNRIGSVIARNYAFALLMCSVKILLYVFTNYKCYFCLWIWIEDRLQVFLGNP